jgi:hypothetical protein
MRDQPVPSIALATRIDADLAGRLIADIQRIMPAERSSLQELLMSVEAPAGRRPIRYLPFNQQQYVADDTTTVTLSLVALLNNNRMENYHLGGIWRRLCVWAFKFSSSPMDRFIQLGIRMDARLLQMMQAANGDYSVLGIVQLDQIRKKWFFNRHFRFIQPLLLIPVTHHKHRASIINFEKHHTIGRIKIPLLPLFRKTGKSTPGATSHCFPAPQNHTIPTSQEDHHA